MQLVEALNNVRMPTCKVSDSIYLWQSGTRRLCICNMLCQLQGGGAKVTGCAGQLLRTPPSGQRRCVTKHCHQSQHGCVCRPLQPVTSSQEMLRINKCGTLPCFPIFGSVLTLQAPRPNE